MAIRLYSPAKTHLWNEIHFVSGVNTSPDVIMSSAKSFGSIPISSCRCRSMPDFCSRSMDSGANMSSLLDYVSIASRQKDRKEAEG